MGAASPLDDIEGFLARHEQKELVRFTTVGSVDDGKSTLIGRLLHDTGAVFDDQLRAVKRASKQRGKGEEIDFSLFTDGLIAEREQGITIDVAYRYFSTETRKFIIADTPGHVEYTRNMATGASTADIAIILLDARLGVLPQSRRHAAIASLLGIGQLIVAVNKMDLVGYDEAVFRRLHEEFSAFTAKLRFRGVSFVPVSAKAGQNVVHPGEAMPWHSGPSLLELLETLPVREAELEAPLRFPVQTVLRPHLDYRGFAGFIARGTVRVGDEVVVLPSNTRTRVAGIDMWEGALTHASAPLSVALRLADEVDVSRGQMIARADAPPLVTSDLEASLVWLSERPFDPSRKLLLKHTSRWVPARVAHLLGKLSLETLEVEPCASLTLNDIVRARIHTARPLFCDSYAECRATGAFILVDALTNATVAAGMIEEGSARATSAEDGAAVRVDPSERAQRLGHRAALVRVEGAARVERALFEQGVFAYALVGASAVIEVAHTLLQAGLVVLVEGVDDAVYERLCRGTAAGSLDLRVVAGEPARHIREFLARDDGEGSGSGI